MHIQTEPTHADQTLLNNVKHALKEVNAKKDWKYHLKGIFNLALLGIPDFLGIVDGYWTMDRKFYDDHLAKFEAPLKTQITLLKDKITANSSDFVKKAQDAFEEFVKTNNLQTEEPKKGHVKIVDKNKNAHIDNIVLTNNPQFISLDNGLTNFASFVYKTQTNYDPEFDLVKPSQDEVHVRLSTKVPTGIIPLSDNVQFKLNELNRKFSDNNAVFHKLDTAKQRSQNFLDKVVGHKWSFGS